MIPGPGVTTRWKHEWVGSLLFLFCIRWVAFFSFFRGRVAEAMAFAKNSLVVVDGMKIPLGRSGHINKW